MAELKSENKENKSLNIPEIVKTCIDNLYNGKGRNSRIEKNQKPGTMLNKVLENEVKTVGLYSRLPNDIKSYIDDKKSKHLFNVDDQLRKKVCDFILDYNGVYNKDYCCFLTEKAKKELMNISQGIKTKFPVVPRTWFNVSERQLSSKRKSP